MKTMETACVSDELCGLKKGEQQIVSSGDSRINCVLDRLATLSS